MSQSEMIIPFLVKILFSSRLRSIQKRRSETERDSVVSWAQKPFCVPPNLFVGNRLETPGSSLSSKGQIQTVANQGSEGMQRQGGRVKKQ